MSSPQKSQTPTLNSLLMKPTNISTTATVQNYGNGGNGAGQEPTPGVYNSMPTTADAYWTQNQRYSNVKGQPLANNFSDGDPTANSYKHMPPTGFGPGSYPSQRNPYPAPSAQGNAPIYNLQQPYGPQGNYVGQQSGPTRTSSNYGADQESLPNGAPSSLKGSVNSSSDGNQRFQPGPPVNSIAKHPTVATLKQEYPGSSPGSGRSSSPASNCTGGAPSSPASHMRHSPVSPTPVSAYQTGGCYPNQSPSMIHPFSNAQPYGGPIYTDNNSNYSTPPATNCFQPAYPTGYSSGGVYSNGPNAQSPPSSYGPQSVQQQMPRFRNPLQGPPGSMGPTTNGPYSGPMNDMYKPPAHQFYNSPGRLPMSVRTTNGPTNFNERLDSPAIGDGTDTRDSMHSGNGTPVSDRPRTSTPASGRTKMNGAKESHPSTPAPASPGGGSSVADDADSSLSSPSWPRTPMSPAIGRHPSMNSSAAMGPPAPVPHPSTIGGVGAVAPPPPSAPSSMPPTHKESGLSLVQRLLGDMNQNQYSIQEWEDRRRFYERLVHFCETKGHPLTGQPTVSKQTVDLYRLYMAVKQNGGFEQVTRNKGWKDLCQVASLPYTSGASYQLRKHYVRYLLPCECYFDRNGIEPAVLLQSIESKRKSKQSKNAQQQNFLSPASSSSPNSSSMGGDIDPDPILTSCQGKKKGKGKAAAAAASAQQMYPDSLMGPPSGKYGPPMENHGTPPNPNVPYMPNPNYPGSLNHLVNQGPPSQQQPQPHAQELVMNPFDDRSPVVPPQHHSPHPQSLQYPPSNQQQQHGAIGQQRPQYVGGYPPAKFPNDRNAYETYSSQQQSTVYQNQQHAAPANRGVPSNSLSSFPPQNTYPSSMPSGFETGSQINAAMPSNNQYAIPSGGGDVRRTEPSSSAGPSHPTFRPQDPYIGQNPSSTVFYQHPPTNQIQSIDASSQQPINGAQKGLEMNGPQFYSNAKPPPWIQQSSRYGPPQMPSQQLNAPNLPGNISKDFRLYNSTYSHGYPPVAPYVKTMEGPMKSYPTSAPSTSQRKDLSPISAFPNHSVEATMPFIKRRRKIFSRDIGKVDAWRVVMALKSGLAFETTWALNVLNVLLYDDSSVPYFGLSTLPGLLDAIIDLYRRSLAETLSDLVEFDAKDGEVSYETSMTKDENSIECTMASFDEPDDNGSFTSKRSKFKSFLSENSNSNYTTVTRKGRRVRFVQPKEPLREETPTIYDVRPLHEYEGEFWQMGGSSSTDHLSSKLNEKYDDALKQNFYRRGVETSAPKLLSSAIVDRKRKKSLDGSFCSCNPSSSSCHERKRLKLNSNDDDIDCATNSSTADKCQNINKPLFFHSQSDRKVDDDEIFTHNNPPVNVILEFRTVSVKQCVSLSNILRGFSFIPGNDLIMAKHAALLRTLASLLLLGHRHVHVERRRTPCKPSTVEDIEALGNNEPSTVNVETEDKEQSTDDDENDLTWIYEDVLTLADDAFVILCNLSANLDLYNHPENVSRPLINALLHWAVCRAPISQDTLLNWSSVAPGRYALEILCKLSVLELNVDLILATPPWDRLETLLDQLVDYLCVIEETVLREFAVVLIHTFCCACPIACVVAALQTSAVQNLISFLEVADAEMHRVVQYHGMQTLRDNPEVIGTSVGMLRRAAGALLAMTKIPACHVRFYRHQLRLLNFTMSHLMDSRVGSTIAEALYEIQKEATPKIAADSLSSQNASTMLETNASESQNVEETSTFDDVASAVDDLVSAVDGVSAAIDDIPTAIDNVTSAIDDATSISEDTEITSNVENGADSGEDVDSNAVISTSDKNDDDSTTATTMED